MITTLDSTKLEKYPQLVPRLVECTIRVLLGLPSMLTVSVSII